MAQPILNGADVCGWTHLWMGSNPVETTCKMYWVLDMF